MLSKRPWIGVSAAVLFAAFLAPTSNVPDARGQGGAGQDSLELQQPENLRVFPKMLFGPQRFTNYMFWDDVPRDLGTFIHQPDTTGWRAPSSPTPQDSLSVPSTGGVYLGTVDRTVSFVAKNSGRVGGAKNIRIEYSVAREDHFSGILNLDSSYSPDDTLEIIFTDQDAQGAKVDFGLRLVFSAGKIDSNGVFIVGMEDFEGFHLWRGIQPDGVDLAVIGEMSKQENFDHVLFDSLYFDEIIPALRATGRYKLPVPVPGIGSEIDIRNIHPDGVLGPNEFAWFDINAFNGFTYYYTVTSFDRGYDVRSGRQGILKVDNCEHTQGVPYQCADELVTMTNEVPPQNNLTVVYTVPNPYRDPMSTSRFTTENYHNFPDNLIRWVNVPSSCQLRVYTTSGDLVFKRKHEGSGSLEWDTNNQSGEPVAPGIYIWRLEAGGNEVYGRQIIIR